MMGATHAAAGALMGAAAAVWMPGGASPGAAVAVGVLDGLFPDIDRAGSRLGRKVWPVSAAIHLAVGHRTLFHAPLLYILLWVLGHWLLPGYRVLVLAAFLGAASHIILDMLNASGVPLLWPWKRRFHIARFQVFGLVDWLLFTTLSAGLYTFCRNYGLGIFLGHKIF